MSYYRDRIKFQNDTSADGAEDPSYSDFITRIPCKIIPVGGGEQRRGKQLQATTTNVIEMRYIANLTEDMIAVNEVTSVTYYITRILPMDGINRTLMIETTEYQT